MLGAVTYRVLRRELVDEGGERRPTAGSTFFVSGSAQPYVDRFAAPSTDGASSSRQWRFYVADGEPVLRDATSGIPDRVFLAGRWVEVRAVEDWHGSRVPGFTLGHARYLLVDPVTPGRSEADSLSLWVDDFEVPWA